MAFGNMDHRTPTAHEEKSCFFRAHRDDSFPVFPRALSIPRTTVVFRLSFSWRGKARSQSHYCENKIFWERTHPSIWNDPAPECVGRCHCRLPRFALGAFSQNAL